MPTECNPNLFEFARVEGRAAVASMYDSCIPFHLPVSRCPENVGSQLLPLLQSGFFQPFSAGTGRAEKG